MIGQTPVVLCCRLLHGYTGMQDAGSTKETGTQNPKDPLTGTMKVYWLLLMSIFLYPGCTQPELKSVEEMTAFLEKPANHLIQKKVANDIEITLTFMPTDLLIYTDIGGQPADHKRIWHLQQKYQGQYYFKMSLSRNNKDVLEYLGSDQYERLLNTFRYSMRDFVQIATSDNQLIPVNEFSMIRSVNAGRQTELLFWFAKHQSRANASISIHLREFGLGTGDQEFQFDLKDMDHVPKLDFPIVS